MSRNRLWLAPMCMYSSSDDGIASDWHLQHYASRAVGGFGVVLIEATAISQEGRISERDLGLWDDTQINGLARIAGACRAAGTVPGIQLAHAGRKAGVTPHLPLLRNSWAGTKPGWDLVAPSAVAFPGHSEPRKLTRSEILSIVNKFGYSASRATAAGINLIEIHGAHGYLIHEFLSPITNHRTDEYGGTPENRRRFLLQIVDVVRTAAPHATIGVRLSATDWIQGGITIEDTCSTAAELSNAGIDFIHVSSGGITNTVKITVTPGYQLPFAKAVKDATQSHMQVVGVGMITSARQAMGALKLCDAVAIGRCALLDPYLPLHWADDLHIDSPAPPQLIYPRLPRKMA